VRGRGYSGSTEKIGECAPLVTIGVRL